MKYYIAFLLLILPLITFSQSVQGSRIFSGKCAIGQTGSGAGYWQVGVSNFNDPGGVFDATDIQAGDYLYFTDALIILVFQV